MKPIKLLTIFYIFLFVIVVACFVYIIYAFTYNYGYNDIYFKKETVNTSFAVSIENTIKEKGKEEIYNISFKSDLFNFTYKMKSSDYENIIGKNNNTISGDVYVLKYYASSHDLFKKSDGYMIDIYRVSFLDTSEFSNQEINKIADLSLPLFNDANKGKYVDLSSINNSVANTYSTEYAFSSSSDIRTEMTKYIDYLNE